MCWGKRHDDRFHGREQIRHLGCGHCLFLGDQISPNMGRAGDFSVNKQGGADFRYSQQQKQAERQDQRELQPRDGAAAADEGFQQGGQLIGPS